MTGLRLAACAALIVGLLPAGVQIAAGRGASARAQADQERPPRLRLIVVGTREEAEDVVDQLARGRDFEVLARERSIDPTGPDGGDLGALDPASLRPELREALRGVGPGLHTGIVRIPTGYAILQVAAGAPSASFRDDNNPARVLAAAGSGAVQITIPVAGLNEADAVFQSAPKPEGWSQDLAAACRARAESLASILRRLDESPLPAPDESTLDAMQGQYAWAQLHAYSGNLDRAIERWLAARQMAEAHIPDAVPMMLETLGVAYLHKAGLDNDAFRLPGELCLFPPRTPAAAAYRDTTSAARAAQYLAEYLERKPDDLEGRWLLNLAYLAMGRYPDGVPARFRIPRSVFESGESIGRFPDVASVAGLNVYSMAGGAVADAFQNDGRLDIVTSSMDFCEPLHYFRNNGDGTFTERTREAGLADQLGGLNLLQADYD